VLCSDEEQPPVTLLTAPTSLLWRHRGSLVRTVQNDIRGRFAGSVLGLAWLVFYPLLFLGAYAAIYVLVFQVRLGLFETNEYIVLIFCGLIPFLGFAEALGHGVSSVSSNASLAKNTVFPIELIPVKAVLLGQCTQVIGMMMLVIAVAWVGRITPWALLLPVVWLFQILFMVGLMWILSSLNVFVRDLQNLVAVLVLILMMVSPIAYTDDMVPANLRPFLAFNPLYYVIISYQDVLMVGQFPRHGVFWVLAGMGIGTFTIGYWFFGRMKTIFVDNI
jgi:lipopolysaccharide transport system permease protein